MLSTGESQLQIGSLCCCCCITESVAGSSARAALLLLLRDAAAIPPFVTACFAPACRLCAGSICLHAAAGYIAPEVILGVMQPSGDPAPDGKDHYYGPPCDLWSAGALAAADAEADAEAEAEAEAEAANCLPATAPPASRQYLLASLCEPVPDEEASLSLPLPLCPWLGW